jgi:hypothetical protein
MSNLKATDILVIQKIIDKKTKDRGLVWDFTNATFKDFVESYTGLDIYNDKYEAEDGGSKIKRLKMFLKVEEDSYVIMLLEGIKEYGKKGRYLCKSNIEDIEKYIKRLKKLEKNITFDKEIFKSQKKVDLLINDINDKVAKKQFELAIDRLHTFFKGYVEVLCEEIKIEINGKSLEALYGELLKYIHNNDILEEGITKVILSSSRKIMKSFDYSRNNKSFAHTNDIMKQNEAEFLCMYIIDLYKFLYKIKLIK